MKISKMMGWSSALCLSTMMLQAQETNEVEQLKKQIQQLQENFEKTVRQQQQQIETLSKKLDELKQTPSPQSAVPPKSEEQKKLEDQLANELASSTATNTPASSGLKQSWSASQPVTIARAGSAYMNISFDTLMDLGWSTAADPSARLDLGDHDPAKRGFSLRNAEISLDGAIDPYFKGFANIVLKLDKNNQTEIELEEAYLQSTSLPANLQLKAGQFFAAFGRNNPQHPHQWAFVDAPIISTRLFGPDGLRNIGAQLSWLAPTPFYTEVFLGVFDGQGGTMHSFRNEGEDDGTGVNRFAGRATVNRNLRGAQDLVFTPRLASSFEITDTQTLVAGLSGAFGPNDTGPRSRTEIYGVDLYWKWKPANAKAGFPFVAWQTEAMYRRFGAQVDLLAPTPLPAENIKDWGVYSQLMWGFKPRWVTGLRGEFASGRAAAFDASDPFRGERYRVAPVLTFYPSEFSKLRLQYNYDHGQFIGSEHSVWLQMEFLLGAHGAHKF
jgi:hypothetical protein